MDNDRWNNSLIRGNAKPIASFGGQTSNRLALFNSTRREEGYEKPRRAAPVRGALSAKSSSGVASGFGRSTTSPLPPDDDDDDAPLPDDDDDAPLRGDDDADEESISGFAAVSGVRAAADDDTGAGADDDDDDDDDSIMPSFAAPAPARAAPAVSGIAALGAPRQQRASPPPGGVGEESSASPPSLGGGSRPDSLDSLELISPHDALAVLRHAPRADLLSLRLVSRRCQARVLFSHACPAVDSMVPVGSRCKSECRCQHLVEFSIAPLHRAAATAAARSHLPEPLVAAPLKLAQAISAESLHALLSKRQPLEGAEQVW